MSKILSIANKKGGVGKSTSAINIAAILAEKFNVLLIDMDSQGNTTTGLGVDKNHLKYSITDVLYKRCKIQDAIIPTGFGNLLLLPSDESLEEINSSDVSVNTLKELITPLLTMKRNPMDYIIIDCPPDLGRLTISSLIATQKVAIPVRPSQFSMEGLMQLIATVGIVQEKYNPSLEVLGIYFNDVQPRTNLYKLLSSDLIATYGRNMVFENYIPKNIRLEESQTAGEPIIVYEPSGPACESFMSLTEEILKRWQRKVS